MPTTTNYMKDPTASPGLADLVVMATDLDERLTNPESWLK